MTEKVPSSSKTNKIRRLVAEERRLLKEQAAMEQMLKNVQALRNKLKIEQIQLCANLQAELGGEYVEAPVQQEVVNVEEEENRLAVDKPTLDLNVSSFNKLIYGRGDEGEEDEEDDDEDFNDGMGCAQEMMDDPYEVDVNFDDF